MTAIREIVPNDWEAFRDIRLASLADAPAAFGSTLVDARARTDGEWQSMVRARTTSQDSAIWLAESAAGNAVGVIAADRPRSTECTVDRNSTELVSMWVAPTARGSGLAARLVDMAVTWAGRSGSASVSLWVMRGNTRARRLYESTGFVVVDHRAPPDDPCRDEIRMTRAI